MLKSLRHIGAGAGIATDDCGLQNYNKCSIVQCIGKISPRFFIGAASLPAAMSLIVETAARITDEVLPQIIRAWHHRNSGNL